jgi:hypothetical protein
LARSLADIAGSAQAVLDDGYGLMLASNGEVLERLDAAPFGVEVELVDFLAAAQRDWDVADLMRVYNVLNETAFGDKGIPLQNWVMIDLGLLPSAFLLITLPLARVRALLPEGSHGEGGHAEGGHAEGGHTEGSRTQRVLSAVLAEAVRLGYDGPIPVAGYCAAPTPVPGGWVGWSLCSAIPGLGTTAKALGLAAYRARTLTGVAQFCDPSVRIHRKFGRMQVLAAVVDLHPVPCTMIYRSELGEDDLGERPTMMINCHDTEAQREIQRKIDAGTSRFYILSPGLADGQVPILERQVPIPERQVPTMERS